MFFLFPSWDLSLMFNLSSKSEPSYTFIVWTNPTKILSNTIHWNNFTKIPPIRSDNRVFGGDSIGLKVAIFSFDFTWLSKDTRFVISTGRVYGGIFLVLVSEIVEGGCHFLVWVSVCQLVLTSVMNFDPTSRSLGNEKGNMV